VAEPIVNVPQDLTLMPDGELAELHEKAMSEFDRLHSLENFGPEDLQSEVRLSEDIQRIRTEQAARAARKEEEVRLAKQSQLRMREEAAAKVHGEASHPEVGPHGELSPEMLTSIAEAAARGVSQALVASAGSRVTRVGGTLAEARRHAPELPGATKPRLAVTAGVDIPGVARGADLLSLDDIVNAFHRAAKGMPVTRDGSGQERLVCTVRNEFEHVIDDRTSAGQVDELLRHLRRPEKMEALVAGGGWCAPSQIRYDFFNVAGVDGLIDLPVVGIQRGGMRYPTSPSIADAFGTRGLAPFAVALSNASDPWLWTETDDIAAVTGSPTKPTIRVACPSFNDTRLECTGITLTAGNLTDDAYPEATQHTLRLLLLAWQHAQNARVISQVAGLAGAAVTGIGSNTAPAFQTIVNGLDLACTDYRIKYAIPDETPLEVLAPQWVRDVIVADLAWRQTADSDLLATTNAQVDTYLAARNIRVQWLGDWQVRGAGQFGNTTAPVTAWPTQADFLVYAAGTVIRGNGLTLDLGVVRDSVLNATNDFTAAWAEECHLVARVGNEVRRYTLGFSVNGATGFGAYAAGSPTARV
jgi:hypothetical protein